MYNGVIYWNHAQIRYRDLISYTFWADMRILNACEDVSPEDFVRVVTPDPG